MAYDIGRQRIIIFMEGFVEESDKLLLVVDVVLDHDKSGNNVFVCIYIVFKVVL